jgi:hypothetical protein
MKPRRTVEVLASLVFLAFVFGGPPQSVAADDDSAKPGSMPEAEDATSAQGAAEIPAQADYKVAFWYRRNQPLDTFRYQIYDVRAGQYTPAVDAWLETLRTKYPHYEAFIRDVDLSREPGETESLKVGAVIRRELLVAAGRQGVFLGGNPSRYWPGTAEAPLLPIPSLGRLPGSAGLSVPWTVRPPTPSMPFPYPYPRPHP